MVFSHPGFKNTDDTLAIALAAAQAQPMAAMVLSSCSGGTIQQLLALPGCREQMAQGLTIVCVTHVNGFKSPGQQEMSGEMRRELQEAGVIVITGTHVLSGAERGLSRAFGGVYPTELIAATLRMLGQGTKVCVECAVMALDAGAIPYMEPIITVGGTGKGVDTAIIMRVAHASNLLDTKIDEILCKPML